LKVFEKKIGMNPETKEAKKDISYLTEEDDEDAEPTPKYQKGKKKGDIFSGSSIDDIE